MKIYTKKGDSGQTDLRGTRMNKGGAAFELLGTLDELCAHLGLIRVLKNMPPDAYYIEETIKQLFDLMGELAGYGAFDWAERATLLEREIDALSAKTPPLKGFVIPGGCEVSARADVARTVARRAERLLYRQDEEISDGIRAYVNRLSDYLFIFARYNDFWYNGRVDG